MKTKEDILSEITGIPKYRLLADDNGEYITKSAALKALEEYKLELLNDIKLSFDICSDTSAFCLGYRNLVDRIRREKENQPIDKSISPIKKDPWTCDDCGNSVYNCKCQ
jgi:hypothetical protein